jgi:predicted transcriptional regulator
MSALTVSLSDEKNERLKQIAKARDVSVDQIIDEMVTSIIADFDAEMHFQARAARGAGRNERGRELLAKALGDGKIS